MSAFEWIGLTLAFLAPLPPEQPAPPAPLPGNAWAGAVVMGSVVLTMVLPMLAIWSFHRPHDAVRARCQASGGRIAPSYLDGSGPYHCRHPGGGHAEPTRSPG
ncbi:hypothetical protein [Methylobacterium trifolii]|uniref:Uncharacterized protein n=1 Tax=Methylobacterium trifolii TaxID=1003092 RepID=A0ABQ4U3V1_9HYPH|nr:hypothetical protein [Methylobacterium trifolii]GJE61713.1 hypothetical protein MPOCJGCO_3837 [Methylobacterium trifolii]